MERLHPRAARCCRSAPRVVVRHFGCLRWKSGFQSNADSRQTGRGGAKSISIGWW
ncbi:Hypothetical protein SMAX5B_006113 [Scophthalmus maximus]|uniref:Uncharacterized protein n=1 Tax=Scophthalmus maximus TaxID=52904 RepID=A0A2U9BIT1_SCOMX|nr:Hypothetical protein SMAX5B_006113 [Scophthalmus maximus]